MKLWIDTEFNEYMGDLISMALIDEHGVEWYQVLECPDPKPWVAQHVMPFLGKEPVGAVTFRTLLAAFLNQYPTIHVIADWPDDIKYFCAALVMDGGYRINTPPLTMEIRRDLNSEGSLIPHNALADARALR